MSATQSTHASVCCICAARAPIWKKKSVVAQFDVYARLTASAAVSSCGIGSVRMSLKNAVLWFDTARPERIRSSVN